MFSAKSLWSGRSEGWLFTEQQCWQLKSPGQPYKKSKINIKRRINQTCCRGLVSLCWLAGWSPPYSVNTGHTEVIVNMSMELEDRWVVVTGYSEQLLPAPWLPLAFLILNNKLCQQAERQSVLWFLPKDCLSNHQLCRKLLWVCVFLWETNHNSCLDESIIDLYFTRWYQTNIFTYMTMPKNVSC